MLLRLHGSRWFELDVIYHFQEESRECTIGSRQFAEQQWPKCFAELLNFPPSAKGEENSFNRAMNSIICQSKHTFTIRYIIEGTLCMKVQASKCKCYKEARFEICKPLQLSRILDLHKYTCTCRLHVYQGVSCFENWKPPLSCKQLACTMATNVQSD